jgi:branched-chain amino acid transport system substrate-binding protein
MTSPIHTMPRRRAFSAISASLIGLGSLSSLGLVGCNRIPSTIKIGVAMPMTGIVAALGQDMINGAQLAIEQINAAGFKVAGQSVTLEAIVIDDKSSPDEGKKAAAQFIEQGVVAALAGINSGVVIAAAPLYAEKGIPHLSAAVLSDFTNMGHATALRLVANDIPQSRALASFPVQELQGSKYAVVDDGTPYGKGIADRVTKLLEGKRAVQLRQSLDNKATSFPELAAKLKADGIDVFITTLSPPQVVGLVEDLKKIDYNKNITLVGGNGVKTPSVLNIASELAAVYCATPILEVNEFTGGAQFLAAYVARFKQPVGYAAHYNYDAVHAIAAAIRKAESADPRKVLEVLRKSDNYGPVTGSIRWDEKGDPRFPTIGIYTVRNGKWENIVRSDSW